MPLPIPPPLRPQSIVIAVKDLRARVPVAAVVALAVLVSPGLAYLVAPPPADAASTVQQRGIQDSPPAFAVDVRAPAFGALATASISELPASIPSQRTPPCDEDLERELRGACWIPVNVAPCPSGKAHVNDKGHDADGRCYVRSMKAARAPTSGEPRSMPIAEP